MRWGQTVGLVRWHRIYPDLKEDVSGGVGLVGGMNRGIFWMVNQRTRRPNTDILTEYCFSNGLSIWNNKWYD